MSKTSELELKFEISADAVRNLRQTGWFRSLNPSKPVKHHLQAVYYDTADLSLRHHSCSLRVRKDGEHYTQGIKSTPPGSKAVLARNEYEVSVPSFSPVYTKIPANALPGIQLKHDLVPIFRTDVRRIVQHLRPAEGVCIEMAVDQAQIHCETQHTEFHEVELELKNGSPQTLFSLGRQFIQATGCRLAVLRKADRGFALAGYPQTPTDATQPPAISSRSQTAEEALVNLLLTTLHQARHNEDIILHSHLPEAVHQFHIALRKLRTILKIYKHALPVAPTQTFTRELSWISKRAGTLRDMDVCLDETLPQAISASGDHPGLDSIRQTAEKARTRARTSLTRALKSKRYATLILNLTEWIYSKQWQNPDKPAVNATLKQSIQAFSRTTLTDLTTHALKLGKNFSKLPPGKRHKLRISLKHIRYTTEFFITLFKKKTVTKQLTLLKKIQKTLGSLNDVEALKQMVNRFAIEQPSTHLHHAAQLIAFWHKKKTRALLKDSAKQWHEFQKDLPANIFS